jgi:hypothetical protein
MRRRRSPRFFPVSVSQLVFTPNDWMESFHPELCAYAHIFRMTPLALKCN